MRRAVLTSGEILLRQARTALDIEAARALFLEYARSLDFELCFQSFDAELAGLPGDYAEPDGRLLLADVDGEPQGCVALHRLDTIGASMQSALALYRTLGFEEIAPYRENPIPTATYLELKLG